MKMNGTVVGVANVVPIADVAFIVDKQPQLRQQPPQQQTRCMRKKKKIHLFIPKHPDPTQYCQVPAVTAMLHGHASTAKVLLRAFSAARRVPKGSAFADAMSAVVLASGVANRSESNTTPTVAAAADKGGNPRQVSHAGLPSRSPPSEATPTSIDGACIPLRCSPLSHNYHDLPGPAVGASRIPCQNLSTSKI